MAVCDLLGQNWVMGHLVPVDLIGESVNKFGISAASKSLIRTSFRHFCCNIAKRNLVMALSLADILAVSEL
jgi:hypothetical protein